MSPALSAQIPESRTSRPAFGLFEGYALSSVLAGLEMAGLLTTLEGPGVPDEDVADRDPAAAHFLTSSLAYLADRDVVVHEGGRFRLSDYGRAVCADKGYLVWLVGGYGASLRQVADLVTGRVRYGQDIVRDGEWVAEGAALLGREDVVPHALSLLETITFGHVLDIGCGNARFLRLVCDRFGTTGTGVDLSPEACALAREAITAAGMQDRLGVTLGDARELDTIPGIERADLVVTFFLLHEILAAGRPVLVEYLRSLADLLPDRAHLLIAEVEPSAPDRSSPAFFTPEFTYVHAMMGQRLLDAGQWAHVLAEAGFAVLHNRPGTLPGGVLVLAEKARREP